MIATVTDLPPVLLEPPESVALVPGKVARLKVRVQRFDGASGPLTLIPEPSIEGVKFENNVLDPGSGQLELHLTATGPVAVKSFRLHAGSAVSPPIELKMEQPEENSR